MADAVGSGGGAAAGGFVWGTAVLAAGFGLERGCGPACDGAGERQSLRRCFVGPAYGEAVVSGQDSVFVQYSGDGGDGIHAAWRQAGVSATAAGGAVDRRVRVAPDYGTGEPTGCRGTGGPGWGLAELLSHGGRGGWG